MSGPSGDPLAQRIALILWRAGDLFSIAVVFAVGLALAVLPPKRERERGDDA